MFSVGSISSRETAAQLGSLVVTMTSPAPGSTVSGGITVSANVSIIGGLTVAGVQFKLDGVNLGAEDGAAPYSIPWNTKTAGNGSHALTAVARDLLGVRWTSQPVTVTVFNDTTAPTVSMTTPAPSSTVRGTAAVNANASDNVGVAGVQFRLDGADLGTEDTTAPYAISWTTTTATNGSHTLTAVARDAAGNVTTSAAVAVTVDNAFPTVTITAPGTGSTVAGSITASAGASDNVGVVGVQFRLDGTALGAEDTAPPYSTPWNTATAGNGSHSLTAVARDAAGNVTTSAAVTVTVDNAFPTVTITAPASGSTVSGSITASAAASDNVGVVGVQFRLDGANLGTEDTAAPYSISWNTTTLGNGARYPPHRRCRGQPDHPAATTVTVSNDTAPPAVTMTSPSSGATVGGTIAVAANASDNIGVAGVQFLVDGAPLGAEATTAPLFSHVNTTTASNSAHALTARARDAGNVATSVAER
jgi:predicted secreted protein